MSHPVAKRFFGGTHQVEALWGCMWCFWNPGTAGASVRIRSKSLARWSPAGLRVQGCEFDEMEQKPTVCSKGASTRKLAISSLRWVLFRWITCKRAARKWPASWKAMTPPRAATPDKLDAVLDMPFSNEKKCLSKLTRKQIVVAVVVRRQTLMSKDTCGNWARTVTSLLLRFASTFERCKSLCTCKTGVMLEARSICALTLVTDCLEVGLIDGRLKRSAEDEQIPCLMSPPFPRPPCLQKFRGRCDWKVKALGNEHATMAETSTAAGLSISLSLDPLYVAPLTQNGRIFFRSNVAPKPTRPKTKVGRDQETQQFHRVFTRTE